jgi:Flp pilus assembly protein TadG
MKQMFGVAGLQRRLALKQRGQVFALVALALFAILGMASLAVDVGNLWTTRRLMQNAADAAAMAGADEIAIGGYSYVTSAAQAAAAQNGFTNGSTTIAGSGAVSIAVYNPPQAGPYTANANAVEVVISQKQPTYFMRVLGSSTVKVSTIATGLTVSGGSCVYALDPYASGTVSVGGNGIITSQCGIYDNSDNSSALVVSGGGTMTAPVVGVVGGTSINGGGSTTPITGIAAFGDPLSWVQEPTVSSTCTTLGNITTSVTLNPGTYCGGIKIASSGVTVNFNPGTYVINGGGLTVVSGGTVNGTGVTFYLTGANKADSNPASYGGVNIAGGSTVNLSAPCNASSGGIPGMLFFQDRSITSGVSSVINGGSASTFSGAMYFPTTALSYAGSSGANQYTLLVSDTLNITGTTNIGNNYSCLPGGSLIKNAALVQ